MGCRDPAEEGVPPLVKPLRRGYCGLHPAIRPKRRSSFLHPAMTEDSAILLVEDNEDDVILMKHALCTAGVRNPVFHVSDGAMAVDYLSGRGEYADRTKYPLPTVVFLDLKLPFMTGHEVLAWIRQQSALEGLFVLVLTSSDEPSDVRRCYVLGANSYLVKPLSARQLLALAKALNWTWLKREAETVPAGEVRALSGKDAGIDGSLVDPCR